MATTKTLGGDRLGSGKKQKVHLHGYERSTHDMGNIFRTTGSAGTLIPFLCEVALPGDTFDIDLDCDIKTHPTIGPLFGSYKIQLDLFECPVRLYQGQLHNNKLYIGNNMANVKLPRLGLTVPQSTQVPDIDNSQINPSCILPYLGIRGVGWNPQVTPQIRNFNAVPLLSYWDIYKNYYANKQEEIGAVIHTNSIINENITEIQINSTIIPESPGTVSLIITSNHLIEIGYGPAPAPSYENIIFNTSRGELNLYEIAILLTDDGSGTITGEINFIDLGSFSVINWRYREATDITMVAPNVDTFPLENIDKMREAILAHATQTIPFDIDEPNLTPYSWILGSTGSIPNRIMTQEGLAIKTYQSDLFNNWLNTEWIDGTNGISEVTAIDTSGGSFTIDTLNLSKKVYEMLNRIAVSGGSYNDWQEVVYDHQSFGKTEIPMYMGGLIKELGFQEVVSNAAAGGEGTAEQPLGTLAGKGIMLQKHKGGKSTIKVNEISYILGIVSLTPRIDYSQGNKWDVHLQTMDDFHKPALDEIGFQELITEQMAWWSTQYDIVLGWLQFSAGKQPAWINYMTNVNRTYGNFAIANNEMFMTLNRRYEFDNTAGNKMGDLTTYIDPVKFNHIFAQTSIDAQNFWIQIGIDMTVRRKMSAKIMPNL